MVVMQFHGAGRSQKTVEGQHRKKGIVEIAKTVQVVQREEKWEQGSWSLDAGYWILKSGC
jgi:hypothetical protein